MEKFGERMSVDDIWRVVLFVKTIPNGTLRKNVVPEPKDYIVWQPSKELVAWLKSRQKFALGLLVAALLPIAIVSMPDSWKDRMHTVETYEEDASAMACRFQHPVVPTWRGSACRRPW